MQEKQNQKKKVLILVLVLGLVLLTIGTTYAFFTYSKQGVEEHVLTTGSLYFVYDELPNEEDSNKISIDNAFPVSDETGMIQDKPGMFEFEVRAKTQGADINYEIYLTKDENSTLPEKVVDTYLTTIGEKNGSISDESLVTPTWDNKWKKDNGAVLYQFLWNSHVPILETEGKKGKSLYQETIEDTEGQEYSKIFRYRMWLDEIAEGVNAKGEWIYGGKSFTVRVNVYASNEEIPSPTPVGVMQSWNYHTDGGEGLFPETDFHTRDKILSISNIKFEDKISIPQEVSQANQWDISEKKDGSVMAYMIPNQEEICQDFMSDDGGTIPCNDVVITSNGETYGNPDSSWAFAMFMNLKSIDSTNFNTNLVENMSYMFGSEISSSLTNIVGLENWDTSSVTTTKYMFMSCSNLTTLNLSNWDTSSVTDMFGMFFLCSKLTAVGDLSGWDTSSVTDMSQMFYNCSQLTTYITIKNKNYSSNLYANTNPEYHTGYYQMFYGAATADDARITVNYIDDATKAIAEVMIETADGNQNVKLGTLVP